MSPHCADEVKYRIVDEVVREFDRARKAARK
jgi:phosphomannomutase/phosphoglucomutase